MTWLLRIFSKATGDRPWRLALVACLLVATAAAATVSTRVELADSRNPAVRRQKDYSGVVVWLEPLHNGAPQVPSRTFTMLQKGKRFIPHLLVIPVGSAVEFPNHDPIFHNAFSNFAGQPFDTGLYPPGSSKRITFRRDGVVRVFCNIHSSMSAVILVLRTPWYGVSDASGAVRIANVPAGDYVAKVWHERAPESALRALERRIAVNSDALLPPFHVSESGWLEVPHKNKHGEEYPPEAPDQLYPGGRK